MSDIRLEQAASNNAAWCAAVWRAHGLPVEQAEGLWFCRTATPQYYPNAVTTTGRDPGRQAAAIAELARGADPEFSVKDSFANLDLSAASLRPLFDAGWFWRDPSPAHTPVRRLDWREISDPETLLAWERAWSGADAAPDPIFPASLLHDSAVHVHAGFNSSGAIRGGAIAYTSDGVIGLTNLFGAGSFEAVVARLSGAAIVCYERDGHPTPEVLGFERIGNLRVWRRER
jgi:hypothetical protein